jgi:hypothetical protein
MSLLLYNTWFSLLVICVSAAATLQVPVGGADRSGPLPRAELTGPWGLVAKERRNSLYCTDVPVVSPLAGCLTQIQLRILQGVNHVLASDGRGHRSGNV